VKKIQTAFILFFIFFNLQSQAVYAQEVNHPGDTLVINEDQEKYPLGIFLEILRDSSGDLSIQDVTSQEYQDQWFTSQAAVPNFGFQTVPYWVRFRVRNQSGQNHHWILAQGFWNTHYIDLYIPEADGEGFSVVKNGIFSGTETLNNPFNYLSFRLNIPANSEQTYYLRLKSEASTTLSLNLWSPEAYEWHLFLTLLGLGTFFGILLINGLYNAIIFLNIQERAYLYLVLFSVGIFVMYFCYDALIAMFFPAVSPSLAKNLILISIGIYDFAFVKFIDSFLELRNELPKIHFFANLLSSLFLILGFTGLILPYNLVAKFLLPLGTIVALSILILNLYLLRRGNRAAKLIIISLVFFLLSAFLINPVRLGIIPSNFITEEAQRLSLVWMGLVWSIALADRMNRLKKEAEDSKNQIEENERKLAEYLDSMPLGVAVYDSNFNLRYINQESKNILNKFGHDISDEKIYQSSIEESNELVAYKMLGTNSPYPTDQLPVMQTLHKGEPFYADNIELDFGSRKVPIEVWSNPIMNASGDIAGTVVAFQSIQDRLEQEKMLRQSEEFRQKILGGSTIGTWMNDLLSGEVTWDPRTMEIFGLAPNTPVTFELSLNLIHPEDRQKSRKAFDKAISNQSNGTYEQDLRIIRPDGQERWISSRGNVIYEEVSGESQAVRMVGIVIDITQQKQAEKELEESRIQYQQLIETMNEGLGIVDKNLFFTYANPRLTEMLGYGQDEIIGKHLQTFFNQENFNIVIDQFEKRKKGGEQSYTVTWQCKDGSELHTLVAPAAVFDEKKELHRSIAVVSDISEQVKANQLLDQRMMERTQEITSLIEISRIIAKSPHIDDQLMFIIESINKLLNFDGASILLQKEKKLISETFQLDISEEMVKKLIQPFIQPGMIGKIFWSKDALLISNVRGQSPEAREFYNLTETIIGSVPPEMVSWLGLPIKIRNEMIGVLNINGDQVDFFTPEMIELLQAFANQIAIIFENNRLYRKAQSAAAANERNRLARELHDSVAQSLYSVRLYTEAVRSALKVGNLSKVEKNLDQMARITRDGMSDLRLLIFELRPPILEELGLLRAIKERLNMVENRVGLDTKFIVTGEPNLTKAKEIQLYWVVYEALSNVLKHAKAKHVTLNFEFDEGRSTVFIQDDGVGFNPLKLKHLQGGGIVNMMDRVESIGGQIKVDPKIGEGTTIRIILDNSD
jgi:PAS domain S-box-containing protein